MSDPYALLKHAKKLYDGASSGWNFFSKDQKLEEAKEAYLIAAHAFKGQNIYKEAGQTYEEAARILTNDLKEPDDAANQLLEASKMYRQQPDPAAAARCLTQSINRWTSNGNFRRAATHMATLGECYEALGEKEKAIESYETAGTWFESDGATSLASKEYLRAADLSISTGDYYKALSHYEKAAIRATSTANLRFLVDKYLLISGLCLIAIGDMVAVKRGIEKYKGMNPDLEHSPDGKLLVDLAKAMDNGKEEEFGKAMVALKGRAKDAAIETLVSRIETAEREKGEDFS